MSDIGHHSSSIVNQDIRTSGHQDINHRHNLRCRRPPVLFFFFFSFLFFYLLLSFFLELLSALITFDFGIELSLTLTFSLSLSLSSFLPSRYLHYHDIRHSTFNRYSIASRHIGQGIDVPCQSLYLQRWMNVKVKSEGIPLFLSFHPSFLLPESMYDLWSMDLLLHF